MPKIIIDIKPIELQMTGPFRCQAGMEDAWWKKFSSAAVGVEYVNLSFFADAAVAAKPPMQGESGDFSDVNPLEEIGTLNISKESLIDGTFDVVIDPKAKALAVKIGGKFGFWAGASDDNDDNWYQVYLPRALQGTDIVPALKAGKILFAISCQVIDKKGKVVKTDASSMSGEMTVLLSPSRSLATPVAYSFQLG